jgi:glycine/D-amino acid oxidase-like deaminating enzyme
MARLFANRASAAGARFEDSTLVTALVTEGDSVVGVETEAGGTKADHIVCVAGSRVSEFARSMGLDLPQRHTLGSMLRL